MQPLGPAPETGVAAPRAGRRATLDAATRRAVAHLRTPLYRNAYALIASTGLTSGLGFVYWLLAARLYPADVVGRNSAALSALMFVAGLVPFSLANVLIRFMPRAGAGARRLVDRTLLVTVATGLLAGLAFVLTVDRWAPSLSFLRSGPLSIAGYALAAASWSVFILQEGTLTGMRQATWIPVRNTVFALAKLVLLFAFAALLPAIGIFASWMLPAALALVPTGLYIRRRLARPAGREPGAAGAEAGAGLVAGHVVRFAAGDFAGTLFAQAGTLLMPVLVTEMVGPAANAHFYLAWTIAYTLYLVGPSMGSSLVVEAVLDPARLESYARRALLQTARIVVPLALVVIVAAPYVLGLLGAGYAASGTALLRLLALAAVPNVYVAHYVSLARARRRIGAVVAVLAAQSVAVLALSAALLPVAGITGVGLAWAISQTAIAGTLLALPGSLWRAAPRPGERKAGDRE